MSYGKSSGPFQEGDHNVRLSVHNGEKFIRTALLAWASLWLWEYITPICPARGNL